MYTYDSHINIDIYIYHKHMPNQKLLAEYCNSQSVGKCPADSPCVTQQDSNYGLFTFENIFLLVLANNFIEDGHGPASLYRGWGCQK